MTPKDPWAMDWAKAHERMKAWWWVKGIAPP